MDEIELESILKSLENNILDTASKYSIPDVMLRRSLNETWFSDTLAWLLDPKPGYELGVDFINNFVECIAKKRSSGNGYRRREAFLRFGDQKAGRLVTGKNRFSLKNAAVLREFYLSKFDSKKKGTAQFVDIAFFDLDPKDGLFVAIENKLFGTNHPMQLETYYNLIEDKYRSAKTREYVYLTLTGEDPIHYGVGNSTSWILNSSWIKMSWTEDVLEILRKSINGRNNESISEDVRRLEALLSWIKETIYSNSATSQIKELSKKVVSCATDTLISHLKRLSVPGKSWKKKASVESSIIHSSIPKRVLYVQMLPNLSLTIQGKTRSRNYYEKILIPFGAHPEQVFHLIYAAARNVYYKHFEAPSKYINDNRKLTKGRLEEESRIEPLLTFLYKYKNHLQVMLSSVKLVRNANILEEYREYLGENEAEKKFREMEPIVTDGDE